MSWRKARKRSSAVDGTADVRARYRSFGLRNLLEFARTYGLSDEQVHAIDVVGRVLPFKTNAYVCEELIDWTAAPADPIYRLTFPQAEMLEPDDFRNISRLVRSGAEETEISAEVREIRRRLNPHPGDQIQLNVPVLDGRPLAGLQHKYRETVLHFPAQGQTCHAYCTYCFRWPQFKEPALRFAAREADDLLAYLRVHPEVTNVLVTGGDPMIMRADVLRSSIAPLLSPGTEHIDIRIGTKAPAFWPYRFVTADDADDVLRLFEEVVAAGRHLALMVHYSHPRELSTDVAIEALRRIRSTGAVVRCQAPIVRHVNDDADTLAALWCSEVRHGAVPYYAFVERDTGPRRYFELPLADALEAFTDAFRQVPGLARTVAGPVMSASPGKVLVDGVAEVAGHRVFVLKMLQARDAEQVGRVFFARFDAGATWFDQLRPAFAHDAHLFPHVQRPVRWAGGGSKGMPALA